MAASIGVPIRKPKHIKKAKAKSLRSSCATHRSRDLHFQSNRNQTDTTWQKKNATNFSVLGRRNLRAHKRITKLGNRPREALISTVASGSSIIWRPRSIVKCQRNRCAWALVERKVSDGKLQNITRRGAGFCKMERPTRPFSRFRVALTRPLPHLSRSGGRMIRFRVAHTHTHTKEA